ncbi:VOC family protein [Bacteroidota bacterium]
MKRSLIAPIALFIGSFILLGLTVKEKRSEALIADKQMMQVGLIVKDVETSAKAWAGFLGEEVPKVSIAVGSDLNPTQFKGKPSDAKAKLAFFKLDNITIELIEPLGGHSTWQEFLDTKGEGIHHIAFEVNDMELSIKKFEDSGIPMVQHGGWATGEYGYFDGSNSLALIIELLENYE